MADRSQEAHEDTHCLAECIQAGICRRVPLRSTGNSGGISGSGRLGALGHSEDRCIQQNTGSFHSLVAHGCTRHAHSCTLIGSQAQICWDLGSLGRLSR